MAIIILLNNSFPFSKDPFIQNELPYLSENFNRVIIINPFILSGQKNTLNLPNNVELLTYKDSSKAILYFLKAFYTLHSFLDMNRIEWEMSIARSKPTIKKFLWYCYLKGYSKLSQNRCLKLLKKISFNDEKVIFYTYWLDPLTHAAIKLKENLLPKSLIISRAHGYDLYEEAAKYQYSPLKNYTISNIEKVYTCSQKGRHYLSNLLPEFSFKFDYSYLGTNDYGLGPFEEESDFTIVSCSSLIPLKRVDKIIEVIGLLSNYYPKLKWFHIGDGPQKELLLAIADKLLCKVNYKFLGFLNHDKIIEFYKNNKVDLFINLSTSEGVPVSIMEAMSFGIPALATDVGGTNELVDDSCGFLVSSSLSSNDICSIIYKFIHTDLYKIHYRRRLARKKWELNFSSKINYVNFCKNVIEMFK